MLETPEAVFEALRENSERPYGTHRTVTAEELVEAAGQFEARDTLVTALCELMRAYNNTSESRKVPVVFARLLALHDESPEAFDEGETHALFWYFKWVTTSLLDLPEMPLATVEGWIGRMRERYGAAGHGLQPVAAMRFHVARHTGVGEADAFDLWATRPRTRLSDCEACELRQQAQYLVDRGEDEAALAVWAPVLAGQKTCAEEPTFSQALALLPLLRLGRVDEARAAHLAGYRLARGRSGMIVAIGAHLEFCAHSRNPARGLEVLAENRAMFDVTGSPRGELAFLTGAEVLLRSLVDAGRADLAAGGPLGRSWTAGELLKHVAERAGALAAAFDARNGTSTVGDLRRARLVAPPVLDAPLALGLRATAAPAPRVAAPAPAVPEDFAELVRRARESRLQGHPGTAALWARVAERAGADGYVHDEALGAHDMLRAEIAEERGMAALDGDDPAGGRAELLRAAGLYAAAGLRWPALRSRARAVGRTAGLTSQEAAGVPTVAVDAVAADRAELDALCDEAVALREADPGALDADAYLTVLQCRLYAAERALSRATGPAGERAATEAGALAVAFEREANRLGVAHRESVALQYAANLAARAGRLDEADARLRRAILLCDSAGQPWRAIRARATLAQYLMPRERHEEAVELMGQAVAEAVRHGDSGFPLHHAHALLGHATAHLGDGAAAVRHLTEAADHADRAGEPETAAEARLRLASVLEEGGRTAEAVAVLESVLAGSADGTGNADGLDERLLAQLRLDLARGLRSLEEHEAAAREFLALAATVSGWEDQATHALVASEAAVELAVTGRPEQAREAYRAALRAHGEQPNPGAVAVMARRFASLAVEDGGADRLEEALACLRDADEAVEAVAAAEAAGGNPAQSPIAVWFERGQNRYRRGRAFASAERFPDALRELGLAAERFAAGGPNGEGGRAECARVAAIIEADFLGDLPAATARLDAAITAARAAGDQEAAGALARQRAALSASRT